MSFFVVYMNHSFKLFRITINNIVQYLNSVTFVSRGVQEESPVVWLI